MLFIPYKSFIDLSTGLKFGLNNLDFKTSSIKLKTSSSAFACIMDVGIKCTSLVENPKVCIECILN